MKEIKKELKVVSINDIHCHPANPRRNTKSAKIVAKSIELYGYINPIVVDEEGTILSGNTRFKALQILGETELDVLVVYGLTEEEKLGYLLADNKVGEYSQWNYAGTQRIISKMKNKSVLKEFNLTDEATNKAELDKLIEGID